MIGILFWVTLWSVHSLSSVVSIWGRSDWWVQAVGGWISQMGPFHHNWCSNSSTWNRPLDVQSAGLQFHGHGSNNQVLSTPVCKRFGWQCMCLIVWDFQSSNWGQWCCWSRNIFERPTDQKPAGHDEVAELKGMLQITPDDGWSIAWWGHLGLRGH